MPLTFVKTTPMTYNRYLVLFSSPSWQKLNLDTGCSSKLVRARFIKASKAGLLPRSKSSMVTRGRSSPLQIFLKCVKSANFGTFWDNFNHSAPSPPTFNSKPPAENDLILSSGHAGMVDSAGLHRKKKIISLWSLYLACYGQAPS